MNADTSDSRIAEVMGNQSLITADINRAGE